MFIGSGQGPVRDFGTERALVEPLGPIYIDFQNSWHKNTVNVVWVCELSEAHTFDFIGSDQEPVRDFGTERALVEPLGPNTGNFPNLSPHYSWLMWCGCGLIA